MNIKKIMLMAFLGLALVACQPKEEKKAEEPKKTEEAAKPEEKKEEAKAEVKSMKGEELEKILADEKEKAKYAVIDVRSEEEFKAGHIPGAENIFFEDIEKDAKILDKYKDKNIVLYCNSGKKSGTSAEAAVKAGFMNVFNADGVKQYKYKLEQSK